MTNKTKKILRWIAVIPGALIAGILSTFPLHWIIYLASVSSGSLFGFIELSYEGWMKLEWILYPATIALFFVLTGSKIAPNHKRTTAIVLSVLYLIFIVISIIISFNAGLNPSVGFRALGPIIGLILGILITWRDDLPKTL